MKKRTKKMNPKNGVFGEFFFPFLVSFLLYNFIKKILNLFIYCMHSFNATILYRREVAFFIFAQLLSHLSKIIFIFLCITEKYLLY